jgi:hypothetical protein
MGLKDQLEAAGYDTSGVDENTLISKLDQAGYDTSSLSQQPKPDDRSMLQKGMDVVKVGAAATKQLGVLGMPGGVQHYADEAGENVAAGKLGGDSHPVARGVVAGTLANAPDLALAAEGLRQAVPAGIRGIQKVKSIFTRPSPQELRAGLQADLKALGTPATDAAKAGAREALPPIQEKVRDAKRTLEGVNGRFDRLEAEAGERLKSAKGGLDMAEENANLKVDFTDPRFQEIVSQRDKMARVANRVSKIAEEGPIAVSKKLKPERIQLYRKLLQEGGDKLSPAARAKVFGTEAAPGVQETMSRALEYGDDYFKSAREEYGAAKRMLDGLKEEKGRSVTVAKQGVAEAGRELQAIQQKFRRLTEEAATADTATRAKLQVQRLRTIAEAESFERKLQRNLKIGWAAMGAAGITGLGYAVRKEITQ